MLNLNGYNQCFVENIIMISEHFYSFLVGLTSILTLYRNI